jgi:uncharacterized protein YfiM (DUF2279 family)
MNACRWSSASKAWHPQAPSSQLADQTAQPTPRHQGSIWRSPALVRGLLLSGSAGALAIRFPASDQVNSDWSRGAVTWGSTGSISGLLRDSVGHYSTPLA